MGLLTHLLPLSLLLTLSRYLFFMSQETHFKVNVSMHRNILIHLALSFAANIQIPNLTGVMNTGKSFCVRLCNTAAVYRLSSLLQYVKGRIWNEVGAELKPQSGSISATTRSFEAHGSTSPVWSSNSVMRTPAHAVCDWERSLVSRTISAWQRHFAESIFKEARVCSIYHPCFTTRGKHSNLLV